MSSKKPWYENDRFWEATQPFLFSERIMSSAPEEVDKILQLLEPDTRAKILDLCCGPGRHSLELARRGYAVTGVDRNTLYLNQAKQQAKEEGLDVEFILEDMRRFSSPDTFDAAISFFTSFGYFDNPNDEQLVLDNIYNSLKPGGRLLMEMVGKEIVAKIYQPRDWGEKDGVILLDERKPVDNWTYMEDRRILIKDGKREEFHFTLRLYSAHELTSLLKTAGFSKVDIYGDLEGAPYDHQAKRLVVVARK